MKIKLLLIQLGLLFLMALRANAAFLPAGVSGVMLHRVEAARHENFGQRFRYLLPFGEGRDVNRIETNGWAIASLVCGVVAFFVPTVGLAALFAASAIFCGVFGMKRRQNHGLAVAGFILGLVVGVLALIVAL